MMLTSLEIENFKGIAARQRIEFAPLTLLFGANSAGKSTLLQALLYLHELIERGAADVDRTELGGNALELGGFARLVHKHDTNLAMVLRAEFATPGGLERFARDFTGFPFPDLDDEVESAWLELTVRFRITAAFRGPIVERAVIGVNGDREPLVWLEVGPTLREGEPLHARVNLGHPLLDGGDVTEAWDEIALWEDDEGGGYGGGSGAGAAEGDDSDFGDGRSRPVFALARERLSALPAPNQSLRVVPFGDVVVKHHRLGRRVGDPRGERRAVLSRERDAAVAAADVRTFLEMVVLGTTSQLAAFLRDAQYIGPLRVIPTRGFLYERAGRVLSWADGLAAWDLLLADRLTLVERTNDWLRRLGAGCQVVVQQLVDGNADAEELSSDHVDKTVRRLLLDTGAGSFVLPSEVGAGISQLIPVIVAAIEGRGGFALIEQPEIHVHPALQVALGDLLIEAVGRGGSRRTQPVDAASRERSRATASTLPTLPHVPSLPVDAVSRQGSRRMLLVETHSEHLILRLLRRIRETTDQELTDDAPAFSQDKLSVLYVEAGTTGVRVRRLRVDERGEFVDRWPKGFFAERMEELL